MLEAGCQIAAYLFRDEYGTIPSPDVTERELKALREATAIMALNGVEFDGHLSNIGPCSSFPVATSVVFGGVAPLGEPVADRGPGAERLRHVPPRTAGTEPDDPLHLIAQALRAGAVLTDRQVGVDQLAVTVVVQFTSHHACVLPVRSRSAGLVTEIEITTPYRPWYSSRISLSGLVFRRVAGV